MADIPLIIGHRGCKYAGIRENSSVAVERAISEGADIIEVDVLRTKLGEFVAYQYPFPNPLVYWSRTCPGDLTASEPLESLLRTLRGRKPVYLDIKQRFRVPDVMELKALVLTNHTNEVIIGSASRRVLSCFRTNAPNWTLNYHSLATMAAILDATCIGAKWVNPMPFVIRESFVTKVHDAGLKLAPAGTENYRKQLRYYCMGADILSSFRPAVLRRVLEDFQRSCAPHRS